MSPTHPGGCACGTVRYHLAQEPMFVQCCHCRDCQRQTGSAFVFNGLIETAYITIDRGTPHPVAVPTNSGRLHEIYRCPVCATALWSDYGRRPGLRFVRLGSLDRPETFPPQAHVFIRSRLPWIGLPPDVPVFEEHYDSKKVWPPASLERRRAALAVTSSDGTV